MIKWIVLACASLGLVIFLFPRKGSDKVIVSSKIFTENVLLGELITQTASSQNIPVIHKDSLGPARLMWNALLAEEIDIYPEYTGTLLHEILPTKGFKTIEEARPYLDSLGFGIGPMFGFSNNFALGVTKKTKDKYKLKKISDLKRYPKLRFGLTNDFVSRNDGWPGLRDRYQLPQKNVKGLEHQVSYQALAHGESDVGVLYTTDAEIALYDIQTLEDDQKYFPTYEAFILYRKSALEKAPKLKKVFETLNSAINNKSMILMNKEATIDQVHHSEVAAKFLKENFDITKKVSKETWVESIWRHTKDHLSLVFQSMSLAVIVAVPLGVFAAKFPTAGQGILAVVGIIQTIPALALLVLLIGPLSALGIPSIGNTPAIISLFLYSLLPIVRNTHAGLTHISPQLKESARALGLSPFSRLYLIEIPLASGMILAGIKTALILNVGFATLGALIGAGGYGQPIMTGIRLGSYSMILMGALPAAGLAILCQVTFDYCERFLIPKGLQIKAPS